MRERERERERERGCHYIFMIYVRSIWYDITLTFDPSVPDRNQGGMQSGGMWSLHGDGFILQPPPEENRVSL